MLASGGQRGSPIFCATLMATRGHIDYALKQRSSHDRPELLQCQASDLKVPKSHKEAVCSGNAELWKDSMAREHYSPLDAGMFEPAKQSVENNFLAKWVSG